MDDIEKVAPLNLAELKFKIVHSKADDYSGCKFALKEMIKYWPQSQSFMNLLTDRVRQGKFQVFPEDICHFTTSTRNTELLDAAMSLFGRLWFGNRCICQLFNDGFLPELEAEIRETLWNKWPTDASIALECSEALKASSSNETLEMLAVVRLQCAERSNELKLAHERIVEEPAVPNHIDEFELFGDQRPIHQMQFKFLLASLDDAIAQIKRRVDQAALPLPAAPEEQSSTGTSNDAMVLVSQIESKLAEAVLSRIKSGDSDWWTNCIAMGIRKKCVGRKEEEGNKLEPSAYLDLLDFKTIIEDNWSKFEPVLRDAGFRTSNKKQSLDWFVRLNELRRQAAHPTRGIVSGYPFTKDDEEFLQTLNARVGSFLV